MADVKSAYYPYERLQDYTTIPRIETLLKKITDYLLDFPSAGYTPPDDNEYPRCRLNKMLFYDGESPLENPLPTPQEKMALVFDPSSPDVPPTEKGYRVYPMIYPTQAQPNGQTTLKIFMSWAKATTSYRIDQAITFEILTNTAYEGNTQHNALSRTYAMACDIIRALNGVNMDGVGTFYFDRRQHSDCEIEPIADKAQNVGYRVTMGVCFMGGEGIPTR